jgi:predicted nucleic acid-binding protein
MRRKFLRHGAAIERFDALWACAACVPDEGEPPDDADARLVAAAQAAGAQVFVTGDQRVPGWNPRDSLRILSPRQAWEPVVLGRP